MAYFLQGLRMILFLGLCALCIANEEKKLLNKVICKCKAECKLTDVVRCWFACFYVNPSSAQMLQSFKISE